MVDKKDNPNLDRELIDGINKCLIDNDSSQLPVKNLVGIVDQFKNRPIPYSQITKLIYEQESKNKHGVVALIEQLRNHLSEMGELTDDNQPLAKIYEHISLAHTQIMFLLKDEQIKKVQRSIEGIEHTVELNITKIDERINGVYAGFVSVLGIFISISFTLFGGVNILNTLFSNIKNSSNSSIGTAIVLAGIATLLIYLLSFTLLNGIQRLSNRFGFRPAPWDDYIMSNRREDLRYRNLFIALSLGVGIIIFGSKYGQHWSIMGKIPFNSFTVMIPYALVCLLILKHGVLIRRLVTNHYSRWGQVYTFKRTLGAVRRRIGSIEILEMIIGIPSLIVLIYSV